MDGNWNLNFWKSGEYQVISERIDDIRKSGLSVCPLKKDMLKAPFKETDYDTVKVAILGQDPYPNPEHAMGISFTIPDDVPRNRWPPTLLNVLKEYQDDLHYPEPATGSLLSWCKQGVFLWNVVPTCTAYKSLSHLDWLEYEELNKEVIGKLREKGCLLVFLGGTARRYCPSDYDFVYLLSHPSPRGSLKSRTPFQGSRIFTTINTKLASKGVQPINWRLP